MTRKFDSEIMVDAYDNWLFRGNDITQPDILRYFRKNLKQNEKGVFIENVFGELSEHGYLKVLGYPCHVTDLSFQENELIFHCDDENVFRFPEFEIYQTSEGHLIGIHPDREQIKYRLLWNAAGTLGEYLEEENGSVYLQVGNFRLKLPTYEGGIQVPLPSSFD